MYIHTKEVVTLDHMVLADGVSVKCGQCLKVGKGGLVACAANDKPEYISNADMTGTEDGVTVACDKVTPDAVLEGELSADIEGLKIGDKLGLAADGVQLAAVEGGAFKVLGFDGNAAGCKVVCVVG